MKDLKSYLESQCSSPNHHYSLIEFDKRGVEIYGSKTDFYLASCSKTIVGALILELLAESNIEAQFKDYLSKLNISGVSIFDFLSHRTNFKEYLEVYDVNHGRSAEQIIEEFVHGQKLEQIAFSYNNTNYVVLYDFIEKSYGFKRLLKSLNQKIAEEFMLIDEEVILSVGVDPLKGNRNQVFGDGGIVLKVNTFDSSKPTFMQYFQELVRKNKSVFLDYGADVDSDTKYNFGAFFSDGWLFHSGFYNNNLAYWVVNEDQVGRFFATNFQNLEKETIDKFMFQR